MKIKICNLNINADFLFFASAALFLSVGMGNNYLCCMFFSSLHEAGHLIAMKAMGCNVSEISLGGMGMKIEKSNFMLSYSQECIVALCGPIVNALFSFLLFFLKDKSDIFQLSFNINLGLMIINMFPLRILDGGRFLENLLLNFIGEENVCEILNIVEISISALLVAVLITSLIFNVVSDYFVFFIVCLVGMTVFSIIKQR